MTSTEPAGRPVLRGDELRDALVIPGGFWRDVRVVADKLVALPEVDYVVMCAGSFDLLAEIVCEDDERLLHVLNDSVRSIPGVRGTETFLYLKLAKQTYTWGTR